MNNSRNERRCIQIGSLKRENNHLQSKLAVRDTYIKVLEKNYDEYRFRTKITFLINGVVYLLILGVMLVHALNR